MLEASTHIISRSETVDWLALLALLASVAGSLYALYRWAAPRIEQRIEDRLALRELLFGRPAEPANPITGAPAQPAVLGIGPTVALHIKQETEALGKVRDDVARIARTVEETVNTRRELADLRRRVGVLEDRVVVLEDRAGITITATAETTPDGGVAFQAVATSPATPTPSPSGD